MVRLSHRAFVTTSTRPCVSRRVGSHIPHITTSPISISQQSNQPNEQPEPKSRKTPKSKTLSPAQQAIKDARQLFRRSSVTGNLTPQGQALVRKKWESLGPPPLSEYRLTFGKHKGKKLDEVPRVYLVKYLIPRRRFGEGTPCPIVGEAIDDYMRRFPEVRSEAGPMKAREEGGKKGVP